MKPCVASLPAPPPLSMKRSEPHREHREMTSGDHSCSSVLSLFSGVHPLRFTVTIRGNSFAITLTQAGHRWLLSLIVILTAPIPSLAPPSVAAVATSVLRAAIEKKQPRLLVALPLQIVPKVPRRVRRQFSRQPVYPLQNRQNRHLRHPRNRRRTPSRCGTFQLLKRLQEGLLNRLHGREFEKHPPTRPSETR